MEEEKKTIEMRRRRREGGKKWKEKEERKKIEIHHFHINYNAPCLFPPNLRGGNKMHYGLCENGEYGVGGKTTEMRRRRR